VVVAGLTHRFDRGDVARDGGIQTARSGRARRGRTMNLAAMVKANLVTFHVLRACGCLVDAQGHVEQRCERHGGTSKIVMGPPEAQDYRDDRDQT
jgi:hypothetical protein